jgi:hypothetical protein
MRIPTGVIPYQEGCAIIQDEIARRWSALAAQWRESRSAEDVIAAVGNAADATWKAKRLRAQGGDATCVMKL